MPFHDFAERGENALEAFEAVGLFEEECGAILESFEAGGGVGAAGEHDFGRSGEIVIQAVEQLDAGDLRHVDIEHDEIDGLGRELRKRLLGPPRGEDAPVLVAESLEGASDGLEERRVVVDEEN